MEFFHRLLDRFPHRMRRHGRLIELLLTIVIVATTFAVIAAILMRLTLWNQRSSAPSDPHSTSSGQQAAARRGPRKELPLGDFEYSFTVGPAAHVSGVYQPMQVFRFRATAVVAEETEMGPVEEVLEGHRHRVQGIVDTAMRESTADERAEPGLESLRNRIRERTNSMLGRQVIDDVVISDVRHYRFP